MRQPARLTALGSLLLVFAILCGISPAGAASPGELLEKAIYTEETVGNIDEAIKLYQKVIEEAKPATAAAAQAQYRLALCYLKKDKKTEAYAALEKLIKEFPQQKELVAQARKLLPGKITLRPAPWKDHEALQLNVKLATGIDAGTYLFKIDAAKHEGKDSWRCTSRSVITPFMHQSLSTALVDRDTFAPTRSKWMHSLLGHVEATYKAGAVELKDVNKNTTREIPVEGQAFDNEEATQLMRRLPLAVGYKTTLNIVATLTGMVLPIDLEVTAKEMVEVPAGKFECFKATLSLVNQTFYISTDEHRYLVKFEAGSVTVGLARIFSMEPGKSTKLETGEISCMLPPGWFAYTAKPAAPDDFPITYLLNLDNVITSTISVRPRATLEGSKGKSLEPWMESEIKALKTQRKNFQVRDASQTERNVAGHNAVSFVADYGDVTKKMAMYVTGLLGDKLAITIKVSAEPQQLDAYRKQLDNVIESLQLK